VIFQRDFFVCLPELWPLFKTFAAVDEATFIDARHVIQAWRLFDLDATEEVFRDLLFFDTMGEELRINETSVTIIEGSVVVVKEF
jgi:hypothetical protein